MSKRCGVDGIVLQKPEDSRNPLWQWTDLESRQNMNRNGPDGSSGPVQRFATGVGGGGQGFRSSSHSLSLPENGGATTMNSRREADEVRERLQEQTQSPLWSWNTPEVQCQTDERVNYKNPEGSQRPLQSWGVPEDHCNVNGTMNYKSPNGSQRSLQQHAPSPLQLWGGPDSSCTTPVSRHSLVNGIGTENRMEDSRGSFHQSSGMVPLTHYPSDGGAYQNTCLDPSLLNLLSNAVQSTLQNPKQLDMTTREQITEFENLIEKIDNLNELSLDSPVTARIGQKRRATKASPRNPHQDSVDDDLQNLLEQNPSLLDPSLSRFACDSGIGASLTTTVLTPCLDRDSTDRYGSLLATDQHSSMVVDGGFEEDLSPCSSKSQCSTRTMNGVSFKGEQAAMLSSMVTPIYRHLEEHQNDPSYYKIATPTPIKPPGPPTSLKLATMSTRTNLKQYLQMQQVQEQERKEQAMQATVSPSKNTQAVDVPPTTTAVAAPRMDVPSEVLKVNSRLENPTQFHMLESRKRQVQEYLSTAQGNGRSLLAQSVPSKGGAQGASASAPAVTSTSLQHLSNSAPSPDSPDSVALSSSATSASEADVIDSIIQMETRMDTDGITFLQTPTMLADGNYLNIINVASPGSSKSCPSDGNVKQEAFRFGDCSLQAVTKDRQKKDNHNMIERRRRFNINDRIKELATLLPKVNDPYFDSVRVERLNKGTILKASVDFIKEMKREVERLSIDVRDKKRLENENFRLQLQIQELMRNYQQVASIDSQDVTYLLNTEATALPKDAKAIVKVKQEPAELMAVHLLSPESVDDLMEDDRHPVNGDPMLPCTLVNEDLLLNESMEFNS